MYDVNRKSGASTLLHPLKLILEFLETSNLQIQANYIPGIDNTTADRLSRLSRSGDYQVKQSVFNKALQILQTEIQIDLFATRANRKVINFVSIDRDEEAIGRDAFSMAWRGTLPLIHPPIPLLLRCLRKVQEEQVRGVVIAPAWRGQPWSHLLQTMSVRRVNLGEAAQVLIPGPRMRLSGSCLPPGTIDMCLVDGEMRMVGECGT
jgi:hypothetical protein